MPSAVLSREELETRLLADVDALLDFRVNALSVEDLFELYERTGFLYPAKAARLLPHLDVVQDNWRRLLAAGDSLLYVLTAGNAHQGCASVAVWRTTRGSWVWQHLVCESNPIRSRAVMLGGLVRSMQKGEESQQNWFRPENRFPARVFGSMVPSLGEAFSSVRSHLFFALPREAQTDTASSVRMVRYDDSHHDALRAIVARTRGEVYLKAEELDCDVELTRVDCLYRSVGLRRTRHAWLAYRDGVVVGAALAYRGPLGLNFSFLENRCDLLLDSNLGEADAHVVSIALIDAAKEAYDDFELEDIPVVADTTGAPALCALGGQLLRNYCQGIWLKDGQPQLYHHVDRFYTRLMNRVERRTVQTLAS